MDQNMNNENMQNNEMQNNDANGNDIRFDIENRVEVVSADAAKKKKNNMLPVIIAASVLLVAVICGIIWFFAGNGADNNVTSDEVTTEDSHNASALLSYIEQNMEEDLTDEEGQSVSREEYVSKVQQMVSEATTTVSEDVGSYNPNTIVEVTTKADDADNADTVNNATELEKSQKAIKLFLNRSCYIKGAMYGGGEGNPVVMSLDGNNFEALTNLDGVEVSILCLDGTLYIKRPATKQYLEMTDTVMNLVGISPDEFSMNFGTADYETMQKRLIKTYMVTINGENGICSEYQNEDQTFKFYTVGDSLKEIDICDSDGEVITQLVVDYISEAIPVDQLTLKGYTASSITVIFADLM